MPSQLSYSMLYDQIWGIVISLASIKIINKGVLRLLTMMLFSISMPPAGQYCEYGPEPAKCYEWMKEYLPDYYARLVGGGTYFSLFYVHYHACTHGSSGINGTQIFT